MKIKSIIVDDEKHTREGLRASLEDEFDVYVAADIASAMNVLDNEHVDLVLTDLRLGGEDGMAVIEKSLGKPHPPVVIIMPATDAACCSAVRTTLAGSMTPMATRSPYSPIRAL